MFGCCMGGILTLSRLSLSIPNGDSLAAITVYHNWNVEAVVCRQDGAFGGH